MLSTGSLGARLAVLRDVLADPTRPLKLGPHESEDFVDLLLRLVGGTRGVLRQMTTLCLMSYQDPRTTQFMVDAFGKSRDAAIVLRLGQRLLLERGVDFFRPFLWQDGSAQAMAAAQICLPEPELSVEERLRIALVLPDNIPVPPIDAESLSAWLGELTGPYRARARQRVEGLGSEVLLLWSGWDRLATAEQDWLLSLTKRLDRPRARTELERLIAAGCLSPSVVESAHELGLALPAELLEHDQPSIRALAVSVGLADAELKRFLEGTVVEALAATRRCPPEVLLELISDRRWQVRAQAVRQLATSDHRPLERVKALVASPSKSERVAAIELLRSWGEEAWLEQTLLAPEESE